jgi:hypothetical protein
MPRCAPRSTAVAPEAVRQDVDGEPVRTADVAEAVGGELLVDLVHHRADAHREHGRQVAWGRGRFSYFDK